MNNFEHAVEATEIALNSAGSAANENSRYIESLNAKTQQLKATFEDFSNNVVESDLVKSLLDLANNVLSSLNTETGTTITQWTLLTGVLTGGISIFGSIAGKLFNSVTKFPDIIKSIISMKTAVDGLSESGAGAVQVVSGISKVFKNLSSVALPASAILSIVAVAFYKFYKSYKEAHPELEQVNEDIDLLNSQLENNKTRLSEINSVPYKARTTEIIAEKEALEEENKELEKKLDLLKEQKILALESDISEGKSVNLGNVYYSSSFDRQYASLEDAKNDIGKFYDESSKAYEKAVEDLEEFDNTVVLTGEDLDRLYTSYLENAIGEIEKFGHVSEDTALVLGDNFDNIEDLAQLYQEYESLTGDATQSQSDFLKVFERYIQLTKEQSQELEWLNNNVVINNYSLKDLKEQYPQLINYITQYNGQIGINIGQLFNQANQTIETKRELAKLIAEISVFNNTAISGKEKIATLKNIALAAGVATESLWLATELEKGDNRAWAFLQKKYGGFEKWFEEMLGDIEAPDLYTPTEDEISQVKQYTDEALEKFSSYYKDLQHLRAMDEIDEETYLNNLQILVDNYTKEATENMKKYGLTVKEIEQNMYNYEEELFEGWKKIQEEKIEKGKEAVESLKNTFNSYLNSLKEESNVYEKLFGYFSNEIDEQIELLEKERETEENFWNEKIESLEEENDLIEEQIELEKLQDRLSRARAQKVLVYKDGKFQYVSDIDEVSAAQLELEQKKREEYFENEIESLEKSKALSLEIYDNKIKDWEKYLEKLNGISDEYEKEQDRIIIEEKLFIDLENENWKNRLKNLDNYISSYQKLLNQMQNVQDIIDYDLGDSGNLNGNNLSGQGSSYVEDENNYSIEGIPKGTGSLSGTAYNAWAYIPGSGYQPVTIKDGKTQQTGLPAGTIVYGGKDAWIITGGEGGEAGYTSELYGKTPDEIWTFEKTSVHIKVLFPIGLFARCGFTNKTCHFY